MKKNLPPSDFQITAAVIEKARSWEKPFQVLAVHWPTTRNEELIMNMASAGYITLGAVYKGKSPDPDRSTITFTEKFLQAERSLKKEKQKA